MNIRDHRSTALSPAVVQTPSGGPPFPQEEQCKYYGYLTFLVCTVIRTPRSRHATKEGGCPVTCRAPHTHSLRPPSQAKMTIGNHW